VPAGTTAFLSATGIAGTATDPAHAGWVEVSGFSTGVSIPSIAPGVGSGRPQVRELAVQFPTGRASLQLLGELFRGRALAGVVLDLCTGGPGPGCPDRITLGDVFIIVVSVGPEWTTATFDLGSYTESYVALDANGQPLPAVTTTFSVATAGNWVAGDRIPAPSAVPSTGRLFARFDGITGGATDERHRAWLAATGMVLTARANGSRGAGRVMIDDLLVEKAIDVSTPALLGKLIAGFHFRAVELELCTGSSSCPVRVQLGDVLLTGQDRKSGQERLQAESGRVEIHWTDAGGTLRVGYDPRAGRPL
jgi:type VI protein secretion system component Hcp